jgi:hypothetical protein
MLFQKRPCGAIVKYAVTVALLGLTTTFAWPQSAANSTETSPDLQNALSDLNSLICGPQKDCKVSYESGTLILTTTAQFGNAVRYDTRSVAIEDLNFTELAVWNKQQVSVACKISQHACVTFTGVLHGPDPEHPKTSTTHNYSFDFWFPDGKSVTRGMTDLSQLHRDAHVSEKTDTLPDISGMLAKSLQQKIIFSREELQKLGDASVRLKDADRNSPTSALNANILGEEAEKIFGNDDPRVELAFQRACALPYDETKYENFCHALGKFYERQKDVRMAVAVYSLAPKCVTDAGNARTGPPCLTDLAMLYQRVQYLVSARNVNGKICSEYSIPRACRAFSQLGGNVDLEAALASHEENIQNEEEQHQAEKEARAERAHEKNERFNALMDTMRSMPGGNDPLAVIHAADQQSAGIAAIADENAARQQAAQQRATALQASAQRQSAQTPTQVLNNTTPPSGIPKENTTVASAVQSSTAAAQYAPALPSSCIGQFWDPKYYNWLSFQNNCGQAIHLSWIAASPSDTFGMSSADDLASGAAVNSGWNQAEVQRKSGFLVFVCPNGYVPVDSATGEVVGRANQTFRCKQQ